MHHRGRNNFLTLPLAPKDTDSLAEKPSRPARPDTRDALASTVQQRQHERLQIEPAFPFGVDGIQAVPLDAMLSEFVTATVPFAFA